MEQTTFCNNELHLMLKELIELKSKRDKTNFTISQLAKAINMPHSILVKLIHSDPNKRVHNPRIDTLSKIVDFFKADGFSITVDDLLTGMSKNYHINLDERTKINYFNKLIPLYTLDSNLDQKLIDISIKSATNSDHLIGFISNEFIDPIFKAGSIFIVDTKGIPEHETLVAVKLNINNKTLIRKYIVEGENIFLKSYDHSESTPVSPKTDYFIIGVVVQVNAKT